VRRKITEAIVGVSALILLALGIPLALAVNRSVLNNELIELEATAAEALIEIEVPLDPAQLDNVSLEADAPPPFGIYTLDGKLMFGNGPPTADAAVREAIRGETSSSTDGSIVVATPITDRSERIVGALRISESLSGADRRSRIAWLIMALCGLAALGLGWAIARRLAGALSRPVSDLADRAASIGLGGTPDAPARSGIAEIDTVAAALDDSSRRVHDALVRERRFSADVSHQLRTPLTGLRLRLETAREAGDLTAIDPALEDLDRLEQTVEHLLSFARDATPEASVTRVDAAAQRAVDRWAAESTRVGRQLRTTASEPLTASGSAGSIDQILNVLVDNALQHGSGTIVISVRRPPGGIAIDVTDEGATIAPTDRDAIFERGHGNGTGIGLALARSLAEAEGGRLLLIHLGPTTFSLILLDPHHYGED